MRRHTYTSTPPFERFWPKVSMSNDCWYWLAPKQPTGYGMFWDGKRQLLAHRWVYEQFFGAIPAGLQIDHLCRNRGCVSPSHLEVVTRKENLLRGISPPANNARKDICLRGHPYTPENTGRNKTTGYRHCRACDRDAHRLIKARASATT